MTSGGLPGVEGGPVGGLLEQRQGHGLGPDLVAVAKAGGGDQLLLGGQDGGAGVDRGPGDLIDAGRRPCDAGARARRCRRTRAQAHRCGAQGVFGDQVDGRVDVLGGQVRRPDPAQGLGANVPDLPGGAGRLQGVADQVPGRRHPRRIHPRRRVWARRGECRVHHRGDCSRPCEDFAGFGEPRGALLGQGAWFVLGVAGLQGGLLGEVDGFHVGRGPPVIGLEAGGQLTAAVLDAGPAGGPALVQPGVDADDLTDRAFGPVGAWPLREDQPEPGSQVLLQGGVVGLRGGDVGLEQDPPVDREPLPGQGLHLVRDRDVGVQVGVPGA